MKTAPLAGQKGIVLIEALVAVLIFSLGILGIVAMTALSIATQSDAEYRTQAAQLADEMAATIALGVDRTSSASIATTASNFTHQPDGGTCNFSGTASSLPAVSGWATRAQARMPGATATGQQIRVIAGDHNRVEITLCWRAPKDRTVRRHTLASYVN